MRGKLEAQVKKAVKAQAKYYNAKHKPRPYDVEDIVYLNSKNIISTWLLKKLDFKFYKPYKVEVPIGKQAYRLKLLLNMKIHNVFHISLLEPGRDWDSTKTAPFSVIINNNKKYEVKEILDSRHYYGKLKYLVKWLEYSASNNQ